MAQPRSTEDGSAAHHSLPSLTGTPCQRIKAAKQPIGKGHGSATQSARKSKGVLPIDATVHPIAVPAGELSADMAVSRKEILISEK